MANHSKEHAITVIWIIYSASSLCGGPPGVNPPITPLVDSERYNKTLSASSPLKSIPLNGYRGN